MRRMTIIATVLTALAAGCALDMEGDIESSDDLDEYADETEPGEDDDLEEIESGEPVGDNLLTNPGFENNGVVERDEVHIFFNAWQGFFGTDANVALVSAPRTGTRSVRITDNGAGGATTLVASVNVSTGVSYELSGWTRRKASGSCSQQLVAYYWGDNGSLGRGPIVGTNSTAWTKLVTRFTAPAGTRRITVNAGDPRSWGGCGVYEWDDFSLRKL